MRIWVIFLLLCTISFATAYRNRKTSSKTDDELPPLADGDPKETPNDDDEAGETEKKTVSKKKTVPKKKAVEEEEEEEETTTLDDAELSRIDQVRDQLQHYLDIPPIEESEEKTKTSKKKTNEKTKRVEEKNKEKDLDADVEIVCADDQKEGDICVCEAKRMDCNDIVFEGEEQLVSLNVKVEKKDFKIISASFKNNAVTSLRKGKILPGRAGEVEELDLTHNKIMRIDAEAFKDFSSLKKLRLDNNKITKLSKAMFTGLEGLHKLSLNYNKLTEIPDGVFSPLKELKKLELDGNKLTFKKEMFTGLEKLEELSIDNTGITDKLEVTIFDNLPNLKILSLRQNKLTEVPRAVNALSKLEDLDISESEITAIHAQTFKDDHVLRYIRITNMTYLHSIQDCAFCGLEKLEELYLQNNKELDFIDENAFGYAKANARQVTSLKKLNLEGCKLSTLSEQMLYYDEVKELGIGGNPLNCTCETSFLMGGGVYDFEYTNSLPKCAYPENLAGQPLAKLDAAKACPSIRRGNTFWRGVKILSVIFLLTLMASGVFMLWSRGVIQSFYKNARTGAPAFPSMSYANLNNTDDGRSLEQDFQPRPEEV